MSDELTPDERELRALTRAELEAQRDAREAMLARDRKVVAMLNAPHPSPIRIARAMARHVSRVRQIRDSHPATLRKWEKERAEIEAQLAALDPTE